MRPLRIVVPTLGRSPWLNETLEAVVPAVADVVIVAPEPVHTGLAAVPPGASLVADRGGGIYAALNTGFCAPGGWAVGTWLNDDDRLVADGFRKALAVLESRPELSAVYGRVRLIDAEGHYLAMIPVARSGADLGPLLATGMIPLAQPGTVFRRDLFERLDGLDARYRAAGDMDFFQRALAAGLQFGFVDAVVAEFRVHGGQISKQSDLRRRETDAVSAAAREVHGWADRARCARWRFRWRNLGAYADRVRRHGFVSMERLYAHE